MLSLCLGVCKEVNGRALGEEEQRKIEKYSLIFFWSANKRNLRIYLCSLI
jgi:hypothetical protein